MKLFNIFKKKEVNAEPVNNLPEMLMVKLFFIDEPKLVDKEINDALRKRFKNIGFPELGNSPDNSRQYFFKDYELEF
ncbi:MAG: hypothetical protein IT258_09725 [Saprospiraceae bacterium]|nr:hypothetical protein [Saprospiraceae bacterium]